MNLSQFFPIWDRIPPDQQQILIRSASSRKVPKGTIIHNGSMDCMGLALIRSGQFRAYILSDEGREVTLYRLFEQDICLFSASCMMRSIQFDVVIQAEKDSEIYIIPTETYKSLMEQSAVIANYTNELMATRFSEVMWLIEQIMWKSLDKRLAAFLLDEAALEGTDTLKLTHEAIANHLGSAREVITRMLRYFQTEGLVHLTRGSITLTDPETLTELREEAGI